MIFILILDLLFDAGKIPKKSTFHETNILLMEKSCASWYGSLSRYLQGFMTSQVVVVDFWTINSSTWKWMVGTRSFPFGVVSWKVLCHVSCRKGTKWWGFDGGESCGKIRKNTFKKSTSIANPERGLDPKSAPWRDSFQTTFTPSILYTKNLYTKQFYIKHPLHETTFTPNTF